MTLGERGGRKESIEGRIYGEKIAWKMRREGLSKTTLQIFTPLSSEETSDLETFTFKFFENLIIVFKASGDF